MFTFLGADKTNTPTSLVVPKDDDPTALLKEAMTPTTASSSTASTPAGDEQHKRPSVIVHRVDFSKEGPRKNLGYHIPSRSFVLPKEGDLHPPTDHPAPHTSILWPFGDAEVPAGPTIPEMPSVNVPTITPSEIPSINAEQPNTIWPFNLVSPTERARGMDIPKVEFSSGINGIHQPDIPSMPTMDMKPPVVNLPKVDPIKAPEIPNAPVLGGLWPNFGMGLPKEGDLHPPTDHPAPHTSILWPFGDAEVPAGPSVNVPAVPADLQAPALPTLPVINVAVPNVDQEKPKMKYIPPWPFSGI